MCECSFADQQLENSLFTDPTFDLDAYLSDGKKLGEALNLLTDCCRLSHGWMQDIIEFLQDKAITNELFPVVSSAEESLRMLQESLAMKERATFDAGLLSAAAEKLEIEFQASTMQNVSFYTW